jgi:DNA-directed RNA polymerase specialized sigma24 family protein
VLLLREYGDLSYAEIARAMTTTQTAVKSILYRARAAFKEVWERRYDRPFAAEGAAS